MISQHNYDLILCFIIPTMFSQNLTLKCNSCLGITVIAHYSLMNILYQFISLLQKTNNKQTQKPKNAYQIFCQLETKRVIQEEATSTEKIPLPDWPVGIFFFINDCWEKIQPTVVGDALDCIRNYAKHANSSTLPWSVIFAAARFMP